MHEWPLWRAAPQHLEVVVKGRLGPRMTLNGPFELLMLRRIRCSQSQFKLSYSIRRKPS